MEPKLKVFLSSAQNGREFQTEREALPLLFDKEPLKSSFLLWRIESTASPNPVREHYLRNVEDSGALLILLGSELRQPVHEEFHAAIKKGIPIFAFRKAASTPSRDMEAFIKEKVFSHCVVCDYRNFAELARAIEDALLKHYVANRPSSPNLRLDPGTAEYANRMAPEERTLRLMVGALDPASCGPTKEMVLETLVLETLLQAAGPLSQAETQTAPGLARASVACADVDGALGRLQKLGSICSPARDRFALTQKERERLEKRVASVEQEESALFCALYQERGAALRGVKPDVYGSTVRKCLGAVIHENALELAQLEAKGDIDAAPYDGEYLNRAVSAALAGEQDLPGSLSAWHPVIIEVLMSSDARVISWLNRLRKSYWLLAVLGVDPDCAAYRQEHLKNYRVYLDSHIVLRALVGAGSDSEVCSQVLSLGRRVGVDMVVCDAMLTEIENAFDTAQNVYLSAERDVHRMLDLYEKLGKKADILSGFLTERQSAPRLSWDGYINRFYSVVDRSKLHEYIRNELGVRVVESCNFTKEEFDEIEGISVHLLKSRGKYATPDFDASDERRKWDTQHLLRTNEARQMAIVYKERKASGGNLKQFWFLTFDRFVYDVSIELSRSVNAAYRGPCYLKPGRWLEILTNSCATIVPINVFRETLLSDTLHHAADMIEDRVIAEMLKSRVDQRVKSIETLRRMFADIVNRPAVQDAYEDMLKADPRNRLAAAEAVEKTIIKSMAERIQLLEGQVEESDAKAKDAEKTAEKARKREKYYRAEATRARKRKKL